MKSVLGFVLFFFYIGLLHNLSEFRKICGLFMVSYQHAPWNGAVLSFKASCAAQTNAAGPCSLWGPLSPGPVSCEGAPRPYKEPGDSKCQPRCHPASQ